MPWSEKQVKTFRAMEHGWEPPDRAGLGSLERLSKAKLKKMADEGTREMPRKRKGTSRSN